LVNASLNWASIVGIVLAVGGAFLYFMRNFKPALARDYDVFFAAIGLLCGGILFFQGWRLDPILQFGQFLLAGTTVFFAYESVRLRGVTTEQARRSSYFDDEEPAPFSPRPGFSGRSWEGESLEEAESFRRRIPARDEAEDDFYRPRRPNRVAIPERAISRGAEPSDWERPRSRPEEGEGGYSREPGPSPSRYSAGGSRQAPADFGARRRGRDGEEPRRGSRPVAAADTMPRSSRRPAGDAVGGGSAAGGSMGRGPDLSDADFAPLGPRGPQGRPLSPQSSGPGGGAPGRSETSRSETSRPDATRAQAARSETARAETARPEAPRPPESRRTGEGGDHPAAPGSPAAAPRDNSSRFDD
jgi:hypothetical protein